jgi:predicted DNA-binding ribbon-helix-helix protein
MIEKAALSSSVAHSSAIAEREELRCEIHSASKSSILKRSIRRGGKKSSVSLEEEFWAAFREIARRNTMSVEALVRTLDHGSNRRNLSSAIRVFVLDHLMRQRAHKPNGCRPQDLEMPHG